MSKFEEFFSTFIGEDSSSKSSDSKSMLSDKSLKRGMFEFARNHIKIVSNESSEFIRLYYSYANREQSYLFELRGASKIAFEGSTSAILFVLTSKKIVKDIVTNESLSKEVIDAVGKDRIIDMSKFLSMIPKYRNKSEHDIVLFSIASILLPFKSSTLSKPSKLNGWYIDISAVDSKIIDLYSKYWDVVIEESLIEFGSVSISDCNIDVIGESNDDIDSIVDNSNQISNKVLSSLANAFKNSK
jgi:hypothetical protein